MKNLVLCMLGIIPLTSLCQTEKFTGQNKLKSCEILMQISPKKKDSANNRRFADSLKNVELVWIYIDRETKRTKIPRPQKVYVVSEELSNGQHITVLIPSEEITKESFKRTAFFPSWTDRTWNKFYLASCYDEIMNK